ncbi:transposase [Patescibacteria group bacterium]
MPYRKTIFANNLIYHTISRGIAQEQIFSSVYDYQRAIDLIDYYRYQKPPLSFSFYKRLSVKDREQYLSLLRSRKKIVEILAFCLMPNHCHFLLRQNEDKGISDFMRNWQNGYAKYFNLKHERAGGLFQSMFKAVRIKTDFQLLHVSRYIHLNPVTAYLIEVEELANFKWSSFANYISPGKNRHQFVNPRSVLNYYKGKKRYQKFVYNQADYQRKLQRIKKLALEDSS